MLYIILYLGAVVVANLIIARVGPGAAIPVAFALIGLDLTSRDHLHDAWHGRGLWAKMAVLIGSGSALSWLLNRNAGPVALASFVAFALAGTGDAITYHLLGDRVRLLRVNGSNVVAALIDSLVFPTLAFGALLPWIVLGQFAAKVGGGFVWSLVLCKHTPEPRQGCCCDDKSAPTGYRM